MKIPKIEKFAKILTLENYQIYGIYIHNVAFIFTTSVTCAMLGQNLKNIGSISRVCWVVREMKIRDTLRIIDTLYTPNE